MGERARLLGIEYSREITKETDRRFLFEYQRAILLELKDKGVLNETQYRYAEERLKQQTDGQSPGRNAENCCKG